MVLILVVWLYGTLVFSERRSGYVIMRLGGLFAAAIPVLHMRRAGVGGEFAKSSGAFFFVWTLLALGVTGVYSFTLAAHGLWSLQRGSPGSPITRTWKYPSYGGGDRRGSGPARDPL